MTTRTLFEISNDIEALENILIETEGNITDTTAEEAIDEWLNALGTERDEKLNQYALFIKQQEGHVEIVKTEADRLKARQKVLENRVARLKERLEVFLKIHGLERVETPLFTFSLQKSGGKPKVVLSAFYLDNPVELPEGLRRVKFEADLTAIRERLEAEDPSVMEIASLEEPSKKLRIR